MKHLHFISLLIGTVFSLTSCFNNNTPGDIEKSICQELKKGNFEKAMKIHFENGVAHSKRGDDPQSIDIKENDTQKSIALFADKIGKSIEEKGGLKDFQINEDIDEDGEYATVTTIFIYGNGDEEEQHHHYMKIDGKWKTIISRGK